ncbi:ParB/RepB/Spo0J family partition protein [Streptococcus sp. X16XC17]|uniref:ParB/RepB/Spo0J family partition protein n=1 Tax=unclassified Streptococcus TaxID=2608887 RepID=UPI00066FE819|nr:MULTISPECIES: ParB/RepB/Spo0J family partition protein [unclassified Streptococcus]TCD45482.1 ParB/RepB/Spo0J family partition protein [Streptococcus sp. X16XC17]
MEELQYLAIEEIKPNPYQPRLHFEPEKLKELAQSIQKNGIIQPLIVRKSAIIGYELLAGERRLRASQLAGLKKVPVIIKVLSDEEMMYQSIIENLQRADLNPIEEAKSYQHLIKRGLTHEEIAQIMGKSRPYITNSTRLLQLCPMLQNALETGLISQGHARLLNSYTDVEQEQWLQTILEKELSVRSLENLLTEQKKKKKKKKKTSFIKEEEEKLRQILGTDIQIQQQKNGKGKLTISFSSLKEFERIIQHLK